MDAKLCCPECFGDPYLAREFFGKISTYKGDCAYCQAKGQFLLAPSCLKDKFELLADIYTQNQDGKPLVSWFKSDWALFTNTHMHPLVAQGLLTDIFDDGERTRRNFLPIKDPGTAAFEGWEKLRRELKHENRFFTTAEFKIDLIAKYLPLLEVDPVLDIQDEWFRARIQDDINPYSADKMGAPPEHLASHGRANPAGIPYLYVASDETTAISEVRPHTGNMACLAAFHPNQNLKVVDLRNPRVSVSPFREIYDEDMDTYLEGLRSIVGFLEKLGDELKRPVLPKMAATDYIPTQYLCEFIKKSGYHGVLYASSVGGGVNMALFNPSYATVGAVKQVSISRVSVEVSESFFP